MPCYWVKLLNDINIDMLPAHSYLDMLQIPFTVATFSSSTPRDAVNVAIALGMNETRM